MRRELDDNKICFITAVNNEEKYTRCVAFLKKLSIPSGMNTEYLAVRGAHSMTEAYQEAMRASDAKYKIYLHQDVECVNRQMLKRIIKLFQKHPEYGMLGVVGTKRLSDTGVWYAGEYENLIGAVADDHDGEMKVYRWQNVVNDIAEADAVDGLFIATQYDVNWRTDLFDKWHFYDISQSKEFKRYGYKVGIVPQEAIYCCHRCEKTPSLDNYVSERIKFQREYFWGDTDNIVIDGEERIPLTSIVILSYNTYTMTKLCIESIRRYTEPGTYEIIVIDNASTDGSVDYLRQQNDIKCIFNNKNLGFPKGCNQGIAVAKGTEILLLNSDTIVTPRWISQLREALYSKEDIGATGCVTNNCSNWQSIDSEYDSLMQLETFADRFNKSDEKKWISFFRLVGFCMLIKKSVIDKIGMLDENFSPGNLEDDDYSFRIREAGYKLLLCRDTFIHHFGNGSFSRSMDQNDYEEKKKRYEELLAKNEIYFCQKWKVSNRYRVFERVISQKLPADMLAGKRILHIGCDCGMGMFYLQEKYPKAEIIGIAFSEREAEIAGWAFTTECCNDVENDVFSLLEEKYQMIVVSYFQHKIKNAEEFLSNLLRYVESGGAIYFMVNGESFIVERN